MQEPIQIHGSQEKNGLIHIQLSPIISECLDALVRVDLDRLERSEARMHEIESACSHGHSRISLHADIDDLLAFARVLQNTRANLELIAKFNRARSGDLEYVPHAAERHNVAKD